VKDKCKGGVVIDDGFFWMEWADFTKHFQNIDVCHRSKGLRDVRLDIHEDDGCRGPVLGCIGGCCSYYCMCKGCVALCCPTDHQHGSKNQVVPQP
jgi:calpain-15